MLISGLVVGLSSHDSGPTLRAVLVGVMVPLLILGTATTVVGNDGATVGGLAFGAVAGLVLLFPAALGVGVGHWVRRIR